jgi:hypothetical protein
VDDCYTSGFGEMQGGAMHIDRLEDAGATVRLERTPMLSALGIDLDANGTYEAVRCPLVAR